MAASNMLELCDGNTLLEASISELQRQLNPVQEIFESRNTPSRLRLSQFVEETSKIKLEPWQLHMCRRLEKLTHQKGQRILLHAPPQHGKSIIVSQRLPAYLIGDNPTARVKVACYNIETSTKHSKVNRGIMQSSQYLSMFPEADTRIPLRCSDEQYSTKARSAFRDGQPSFKAIGLATGFTGEGAEHLIIDDPYASDKEAKSAATAKNIWSFWKVDCSSRIDDDTNVVIMFHRYHEDDFIGELIRDEGLQSQGGVWELITYRAEWDDDVRPEIGGLDPMRRKKGQYLSPRMAKKTNNYLAKKKDTSDWLALFQGKPSKIDGSFFLVNKLRVISRIPLGVRIVKICRAWDLASSENGDYTVGVLMALGDNDYIYILDVVRIRETTDERNRVIKFTTREDRRRYRKLYDDDITTLIPQDPNSAGKDIGVFMRKMLVGYPVEVHVVSGKGDKEYRADGWSGYVNAGLVRLVYDGELYAKDDYGDNVSWVPDFIEEHRRFPGGPTTKKDQVDACSDAYSKLDLNIEESPGESFDTLGLQSEWDTSQGFSLTAEKVESEEDLFNEILGVYEEEGEEDSYGDLEIPRREQRLRPTNTYSTRRQREDAKQTSPRRFRLKRSNRNRQTRST